MINSHTKPLSLAWVEALAREARVEIPAHIMPLMDILADMSEIAITDFRSKAAFNYKDDGSPAGNADLAIETLLKDHLTIHDFHAFFKGEELGDNTPEEPKEGDARHIVDPIDGTRNNEYGRDDFSISIARQVFKNGAWQTNDALLVLPVKGEVLWASKNQGAFILQHNPLATDRPSIQIIKITNAEAPKPLDRSLIDLSTKPMGATQEAHVMRSFRDKGLTQRTIGSAANALAYTGTKNDGAVVIANDYDVAAGALIAEETGAIVSEQMIEVDGRPKVLVTIGRDQATHDALDTICQQALEL